MKSLITIVYATDNGVLYRNILCHTQKIKKKSNTLGCNLGYGKYCYFSMDTNDADIKKYYSNLNLTQYPSNFKIKILNDEESSKIDIKKIIFEDDIWWIIAIMFPNSCSNGKFERGRIIKVFDACKYSGSDKLIVDIGGITLYKNNNLVKITYETSTIFVVLQLIGVYASMISGRHFHISIPPFIGIEDEIDILKWLCVNSEITLFFDDDDYFEIKSKIIITC